MWPYIPGEPLTDCFDTLAHTLDPRVQGDQLKNRLLLKDGLEAQGFVNYENEWWHFTFKPEPFPTRSSTSRSTEPRFPKLR